MLEGRVQISPGTWISKPKDPPAPVAEKEVERPQSRDEIATTLARVGVYVDTSIATVSDIAEERKKKQKEHEQMLADHEKQRQAREQLAAKSDCESMLAIVNGKVDSSFMELLRGVIASNRDTGEIDWIRTKIERNRCLEAHARMVEDGVRFTIGGAQ